LQPINNVTTIEQAQAKQHKTVPIGESKLGKEENTRVFYFVGTE